MPSFSLSKLRIGTKLGLSAAIGALFVAGMTANQMIGNASVAASSEEVNVQNTIIIDAVETKASVRGMLVGVRDIRLAVTQEDMDKALAFLAARERSANRFADEALKLVHMSDNRERLQKLKSLVTTYVTASREVAAARSEIIGLTAKRQDNGNDWRRRLEIVNKSPDLAKAANRAEIETAVRQANELFGDARTGGWRYAATFEAPQVQRFNKAADDALAALATAQRLAADKVLADSIATLAAPVNDFKTLMARQVALSDLQFSIVRGRTLPTAAQIGEIIDKIVETARGQASAASAAAIAQRTSVERIGLAIAMLVLAILIGSAVFGALAIARPIRRIGEVLLELANGNKQVDVPYAERGDEVGDNARAARTFKENLIRIEKMEAEQRDAEVRAAQQRKADMHKLADEFQAAVGGIVDTVSSASTELEAAAGTLTKTAEMTQGLSSTVAAASEQASANVQSVATATEEMTSSVDEISRQVQESARISADAVKQAEKTDARINELSQAASRIGDVVKLITAIAEQTNLLALNATIEAARAGEAGRGFAVVASEVKQLASQTAKATDEIGTQIAGMQTATQESVAAIKEIGGTIGRISEIASTIAAAVEEQGAATQEIARNVGEAAKGTQQVATNITDVNRGAGETGSASAQVLSSAQSLSSESHHLRMEVDKFLSTVRAA